MSLAATVFLGAVAGFTIFLGLPFARLKSPPLELQIFLNAVATGILVFLLWDVITQASERIQAALAAAHQGKPSSFWLLITLFATGFGVGLLSLVYYERRLRRSRGKMAAHEQRVTEITPQQLALMIATGIGLHNFSEGLAIGQSSRAGAIGLATILIVGFGLHNMTEGFGIAAPLTMAGARPPWSFLALAGLIGGGPTFLGTVIGFSVQSDAVFVLCLALAAGSILYVVGELLHAGRRMGLREVAMWGVFLGFLAAYATDLLLTWAGV
jgi:ZIP family zinc transporter